uniref:Uncharacterized protein n=1 Tax=Glossina pallidipes TaxID=7398 RepID=A0A1A9ZUD9_GLOPL
MQCNYTPNTHQDYSTTLALRTQGVCVEDLSSCTHIFFIGLDSGFYFVMFACQIVRLQRSAKVAHITLVTLGTLGALGFATGFEFSFFFSSCMTVNFSSLVKQKRSSNCYHCSGASYQYFLTSYM